MIGLRSLNLLVPITTKELGLQRDIAIGVINLGVTVLPSNRYCFMCGHATTQRFMEFQEYKKVSKFHLLRRNLQHLPFLSRFLLRGSHITSSSFTLKVALKFSSFLAKAQKPSYSCWDGFLFGFGLMNSEVHFSAGHYTTFGWLCQQKFSLCAARRGACSDYTEVQWWYIIIILSPL